MIYLSVYPSINIHSINQSINDIVYIDNDLSPIIFADDTSFICKADTIVSLENVINYKLIKINIGLLINYILI